MDTSKKFIRQCIGAFEDIGYISSDIPPSIIISDGWETNQTRKINGHFLTPKTSNTLVVSCGILLGQLYRQDQLQEIFSKDFKELIRIFFYYLQSPNYMGAKVSEFIEEISMEQLWLAFVMNKKYNKIWNDKTEKWENYEKN